VISLCLGLKMPGRTIRAVTTNSILRERERERERAGRWTVPVGGGGDGGERERDLRNGGKFWK
jgi:hypothetical protein